MTCKDCIHYDACKFYTDKTKFNMPKNAENCDDFKDKSKYTELPCKVGDTVYVIQNHIIRAKDIIYYNKIHSRIAEQNEEYWHCVDKDAVSINTITFYPDDIGQTVFLTREDAEQKLRKQQVF